MTAHALYSPGQIGGGPIGGRLLMALSSPGQIGGGSVRGGLPGKIGVGPGLGNASAEIIVQCFHLKTLQSYHIFIIFG